MSRRAVGDHAALGVLHSGGSSAAGTHQSRELITSTPRRRPAAGGARSWNHGPQGRVVEAGAPLGGASLPGNHPGAASPEGCAPLRHNHVWGHTARGTQRPGDSALRGAAPGHAALVMMSSTPSFFPPCSCFMNMGFYPQSTWVVTFGTIFESLFQYCSARLTSSHL